MSTPPEGRYLISVAPGTTLSALLDAAVATNVRNDETMIKLKEMMEEAQQDSDRRINREIAAHKDIMERYDSADAYVRRVKIIAFILAGLIILSTIVVEWGIMRGACP